MYIWQSRRGAYESDPKLFAFMDRTASNLHRLRSAPFKTVNEENGRRHRRQSVYAVREEQREGVRTVHHRDHIQRCGRGE